MEEREELFRATWGDDAGAPPAPVAREPNAVVAPALADDAGDLGGVLAERVAALEQRVAQLSQSVAQLSQRLERETTRAAGATTRRRKGLGLFG